MARAQSPRRRQAAASATGSRTRVRTVTMWLMGVTADGTKELIAIHDGQRESETSWLEVLPGLKDRGLLEAPKLATGDGSLGFWLAMAKAFPSTK